MATETERALGIELGRGRHHLAAGGVGGFLGGVVFGGGVMNPAEMMPMVAALYGLEGVVAGWLAHLFHSVVFGMVFAAIVAVDGLRGRAVRPSSGAVVGAVYGLVVWLVAAAFVMPLWIGAVTPMSPPVPDFNPMSFVGHLVYGVTLGALYPLLIAHER